MSELSVIRKRASGKRVGTLVVNPGGPGASAVEYLRSTHAEMSEAVRQGMDVVAFDPRGVGGSRPVRCLSGGELDAYYAIDPSPDTPAELQALEAGSRKFANGCTARSAEVLDEVSTRQVVSDLEVLRQALGEEKLHYLGYSYGTAIGAGYIDAHPTRVGRFVLDGAVDPSLRWDQVLEGQGVGFEQALGRFLTWCENTPAQCPFAKGSGSVQSRFQALNERIETRPLPAGKRSVGPGEFSYGVGVAMYATEVWPVLGQALADGAGGDGALLLRLSDAYLQREEGAYAPTLESNTAVNCIDRPWPRDRASYEALADRLEVRSPQFGAAIALSGLTCLAWSQAPQGTPGPVRGAGAPPVVIIGTTGDPATPYQWAQGLARQLESGVLLTYRGDGHTAYAGDGPKCIRTPVDTYLLTGTAPAALTC